MPRIVVSEKTNVEFLSGLFDENPTGFTLLSGDGKYDREMKLSDKTHSILNNIAYKLNIVNGFLLKGSTASKDGAPSTPRTKKQSLIGYKVSGESSLVISSVTDAKKTVTLEFEPTGSIKKVTVGDVGVLVLASNLIASLNENIHNLVKFASNELDEKNEKCEAYFNYEGLVVKTADPEVAVLEIKKLFQASVMELMEKDKFDEIKKISLLIKAFSKEKMVPGSSGNTSLFLKKYPVPVPPTEVPPVPQTEVPPA